MQLAIPFLFAILFPGPTNELPRAARPAPRGQIPLDRAPPAASLDSLTDKDLLAKLDDRTWVFVPEAPSDPLELTPAWHHPAITILVRRHDESGPGRDKVVAALQEAVDAEGNPVRRFNAALALAGLGERSSLKALDEALLADQVQGESPDQARARRTMACHALARFPKDLDADVLGALFERWFPSANSKKGIAGASAPLGVDEPIAIAILWAWTCVKLASSDFDPSTEVTVQQMCSSSSSAVRRIGAIAFSGRSWPKIPSRLQSILADPDARVRAAALAALTRYPDRAAREAVVRMTNDLDISTRTQAIRTLAGFADADALDRLEELSGSESVADRLAVVDAASQIGGASLLERLARDPSSRVRAAVAGRLGRVSNPAFEPVLRRMLGDRDPHVQACAVESIALLPAASAIPLLLAGMESNVRRTRLDSARHLATIWPPAATLPNPDSTAEFKARTRELAQLWDSKGNRPPDIQAAVPRVDEEVSTLLHQFRGADPTEHNAILHSLRTLGPRALTGIEAFCESARRPPHPRILQDVLAPLDETYSAIARFATDPEPNPAAVSQIVRHLENHKLSVTAAMALADELERRGSSSCWLRLAPMLERDQVEVAARLDSAGAGHRDAQIRWSTCERIGGRATASHADVIRPLLSDADARVQESALRVAGRTRDTTLIPAVAAELPSRNPRIRIAAASSLLLLGDRRGIDELSRMIFDPDQRVRQELVRELNDPLYRPLRRHLEGLLLACLDDAKLEVRKEAMSTLQTLTGESFAHDRVGRPVPFQEQVARWRNYLRENDRFDDQQAN